MCVFGTVFRVTSDRGLSARQTAPSESPICLAFPFLSPSHLYRSRISLALPSVSPSHLDRPPISRVRGTCVCVCVCVCVFGVVLLVLCYLCCAGCAVLVVLCLVDCPNPKP